MNKSYDRVLRFVRSAPWAMLQDKLIDVMTFLNAKENSNVTDQEFIIVEPGDGKDKIAVPIKRTAEGTIKANNDVRAQTAGEFTRVGSLAIIPIFGVISRRTSVLSEFSGATSTEKLGASVRRAVADKSITTIVLDIDSPGGRVTGVPELVAELLEAREQKRIVAVVNGLAASAAFWIAAAASEIVVTPSGSVGSIGAFIVHQDISERMKTEGIKTTFISAGKFKTEGNEFEPLSPQAQKHLQDIVDEVLTKFVKDVATGRNVSVATVRKDFGEGRTVTAEKAKAAGMVDRIATMDQTIARLLTGRDTRTGSVTAGTVREFESFLRDEGDVSNAEAKRIASLAFKSKADEQRDAVESAAAQEATLLEIKKILS